LIRRSRAAESPSETPISRRIGRVDRLGDDAFEAELDGVLQDEFAVAGIMVGRLGATDRT
jgi:hypothetical protein